MSKKTDMLTFIFLSYSLAWLIWIGLWLADVKLGEPIAQAGTILAMWMPAFAFFILKKRRSANMKLQAQFSTNLKGCWRY